jgi:hypothetical protein
VGSVAFALHLLEHCVARQWGVRVCVVLPAGALVARRWGTCAFIATWNITLPEWGVYVAFILLLEHSVTRQWGRCRFAFNASANVYQMGCLRSLSAGITLPGSQGINIWLAQQQQLFLSSFFLSSQ